MTTQHDVEQITNPFDVVRQAALIGAGSGAQWFAIGTTFWTIRSSILSSDGLKNWYNVTRNVPLVARQDVPPTPSDRIRASTISGALTGATLGLLFRGPRNVIPGTIMFSLFGWSGQKGYNWLDGRNSVAVKEEMKLKEEGKEKENWLQRLSKSKWSPMSALSDEEYEKMIGEKILTVEADIALIDERIEGLRKKKQELEKQSQQSQEKK